MARGDQLGRQWKIIQTLLTSSGKSAAELAAELDIHPRTVYRDLVALQTAGFPIYTERTDGKSLWSLLDTMKHHIPVPFTLPELMAHWKTEPEMGRNGETVTFKRSILSFISGSPIHRFSASYHISRGGSSSR
jgi:biotin operon repressor